MANIIPGDMNVVGGPNHTPIHNNMSDVLALLAGVLALAAGSGAPGGNPAAISQLEEMSPSWGGANGQSLTSQGPGLPPVWANATLLAASGDITGATDTAQIQTALNAGQFVLLAPGAYYIGTAGNTATGLTVPGASNTVPGGILAGSGSGFTKLFYLGNGTAVYSHGTQTGGEAYQGIGATIRDLEIDGSNCGAAATVIGLDVGDQYDILIDRVTVSNFTSTGTTSSTGANPLGAVGIGIHNYFTVTEKCYLRHVTVNNCGTPNIGGGAIPSTGGGAAIQFYTAGAATTTSHMYGDYSVHINQQNGQNGLVIARQGHLMNGRFTMRGNMNAPSTGTNGSAAIVIGVGGSAQAGHIQRMNLDIHVESDGGSGGSLPYTFYQGGNADNTVNRCQGRLQFLDGFQTANFPGTDGTFEFFGPIIGGDTNLTTPPAETFPNGSTVTYNGIPVSLYIKASGGSVSAVVHNGVNIPSNDLGGPYDLCAGMTINISYTGTLAAALVPVGQGY